MENVDCIIYPRVSTEEQRKNFSPDEQIRRGVSLCKEKGWTYQIEKGDLGKSGSAERLEDRPALTKIVMDYAFNKKFKYLFVADIDRLSRHPGVLAIVKKAFLDNGIKIVTPNQTFDLANESDDLFSDLLGLFAKVENKKRMANFARGREGGRRSGCYTGGWIPYGYKKVKVMHNGREKSKYALDEKTAPIYKRMVSMYEAGDSTSTIAIKFNAEKVPPPGKSPVWRHEAVLSMLHNDFYMGVARHRKTGEVLSTEIPALITRERWDRLQNLLTKRSPRGTAKKHFSLLRGLLECGRCGSGMEQRFAIDKRIKRENYSYKRYRCSRVKLARVARVTQKQKPCNLPTIDAHELDLEVWDDACHELFMDQKGLKEALKSKVGKEEDPKKIKAQIAIHEAFIQSREKGRASLLDLVQKNMLTPKDFTQRDRANQAMISEKRSVIEALKDKLEQGSKLKWTEEAFCEAGLALRLRMERATKEQKRLLLQKIIDKVVVDFQGDEEVLRKTYKHPFRRSDWVIEVWYTFDINELQHMVEDFGNHIRYKVEKNL